MPTGDARKFSRRAQDSNGGGEKSKRGGGGGSSGGSKSSFGVRRKDTKQKVKSSSTSASASRVVVDSSDDEDRNGFGILDSPTVKSAADSSLVYAEEDEVRLFQQRLVLSVSNGHDPIL